MHARLENAKPCSERSLTTDIKMQEKFGGDTLENDRMAVNRLRLEEKEMMREIAE